MIFSVVLALGAVQHVRASAASGRLTRRRSAMGLTSLCRVLFVGLATTISIAQSAAVKRDVVLELTLPNGATPQLRVPEAETGSVELPDIGKFGFVPTFENSDTRN